MRPSISISSISRLKRGIQIAIVGFFALGYVLSGPSDVTWSQEKSALDLLDEATDLKLSLSQRRYSVRDLDRVVTLCEAAIQAGLEEANESYAKQLLTATLYEQAEMLIDPVLEGRFDPNWRRRRSLALEAIEKALEYLPDNGEAQLMLARIHGLPGGDRQVGLEAGNRAVELLSGNPARKALALLARAGFQSDNKQRLADYDAAVELGGGNLEAYRERGRARLIAEDLENAIADFRQALKADENDLETIQLLTQAFVTQEKYDEAIEQVDRLIAADPEDSSGFLLRARIHVSNDDFENAIGDLNSCLRVDPTNLEALLSRAALRQATDDLEEAMADVSRALELRPGLRQAILLRSQIALAVGDFSQAIRDLRQLIRREPDNLEYRMRLAMTYLGDERPEESVRVYDEIIERDHQAWKAVRGRADAYLGIGKHAEAIADYQRVLQHMSDDSGLLNNLAWVLATSPEDHLRDGERALELAQKACELTDYQAPHIISTLAACHAELGQFDEAIKWSSKAVEMESGELKEQLTGELESYQAGKPWREKQESNQKEDASVIAPDDLFIDESDAVEPTEAAQNQPSVPD